MVIRVMMFAMTEYENIPVKPETKKLVDELGHKGETYDEIIMRLVSAIRK